MIEKSSLGEYKEGVASSAFHRNADYWKDYSSPAKLRYFLQRHFNIAVKWVNRKLVGSVNELFLIKVEHTAEYSRVAKTAYKGFFHSSEITLSLLNFSFSKAL